MKVKPLKIHELSEKRQRDTRYHEAGHVVAAHLMGEANRIVHVSMKSTSKSIAHVRREGISPLAYPIEYIGSDGQTHSPREVQVVKTVIIDLLAPAVDAARGVFAEEAETCDHWLEHIEIDSWCQDASDYEHALDTARMMGDDREHYRLYVYARWCDELLKLPRVWSTVEAVANVLTVGRIIPAETIWETLDAAWGESSLPVMDLPRKWRHRLLAMPWKKSARRPRFGYNRNRAPEVMSR